MFVIWFVFGILTLTAELATGAFVLLWFSLGAFAASVSTFLTDSFAIQGIIFILSSLILFLTLKSYIKNKTHKETKK
ncbi:NfeD family protein [Cytobacillus sp. FJAT-54145]|uniref:NfeD family protein n=1 Tax=Cytobacillus spartinae TaxID=3299023 RepID=A0ABW6KA41_9BACI